MKNWILYCAIAFAIALQPCAAAPTDEEVQARKIALDLAGAFSNDGFKLRDGHWCGQLAPGKDQLVQVNLYAGNEYWFSVGATASAKKLVVSVFDELGHSVEVEPYAEGQTAAAGFAPSTSGPYYIKVGSQEGAAATFCLIYSYK